MFKTKNNIGFEVKAIVKRRDGTIEDLGIISRVPLNNKNKKSKLVNSFSNLTKTILSISRKDDK